MSKLHGKTRSKKKKKHVKLVTQKGTGVYLGWQTHIEVNGLPYVGHVFLHVNCALKITRFEQDQMGQIWAHADCS